MSRVSQEIHCVPSPPRTPSVAQSLGSHGGRGRGETKQQEGGGSCPDKERGHVVGDGAFMLLSGGTPASASLLGGMWGS